jgi:hypothetical protein
MLTRDFESCEVAQILPVNASSTKDVNHIINESRCVTFAGRWDETDALKFGPLASFEIERPSVVVVVRAIGAAEAVEMSMTTDYQVSEGRQRT